MIRPLAAAAALVTTLAACTNSGPPTPSIPLVFQAQSQCHVVNGAADRRCTPGALNPGVSQTNIHGTICVPGWTATIRPPASYTTALKRRQKVTYGETNLTDAQLEEDHLISLSAGGSPTDPANLFPQPWSDAHRKDIDERRVQRDICTGRSTLKQGQDQLLSKWSHE